MWIPILDIDKSPDFEFNLLTPIFAIKILFKFNQIPSFSHSCEWDTKPFMWKIVQGTIQHSPKFCFLILTSNELSLIYFLSYNLLIVMSYHVSLLDRCAHAPHKQVDRSLSLFARVHSSGRNNRGNVAVFTAALNDCVR